MNRHIKAVRNGPYQEIVSPGVLRFLDFSRLTLGKGEKHSGQTGEREAVLDFFGGTASISIRTPDGEAHTFAKVGGRPDVFSGPPQMVYIPPRSSCELTARSSLDAGIFTAPSRARTAFAHSASSATGRHSGAGTPRANEIVPTSGGYPPVRGQQMLRKYGRPATRVRAVTLDAGRVSPATGGCSASGRPRARAIRPFVAGDDFPLATSWPGASSAGTGERAGLGCGFAAPDSRRRRGAACRPRWTWLL